MNAAIDTFSQVKLLLLKEAGGFKENFPVLNWCLSEAVKIL